MEIDLIMGLANPKTALTEPKALSHSIESEEAFSDFTVLLEGEGADSAADGEVAVLTLPHQFAVVKSPDSAFTVLPQQIPEQKTIASDAPIIAAGQPRETKISTETPHSTAPFMPAIINTEHPVSEAPAVATPIRVAETQPGLTPLNQPAAPLSPLPSTAALDGALPQQVFEPPATALPNPASNTHIAVIAPLTQSPAARPQSRMAEAHAEIAPRIEPAQAQRTVTSLPAKPQPLQVSTIATLEPEIDDTETLPFSIKIERQVVESSNSARPASQAPPVASQITSQLPQLLSRADKQIVELRLDPPELGRVTIHLSTNDQQVTAHVVAERVDTVDLMRRHADLLTATLARAGFSQADLSFQQGSGQKNEGSYQQYQSSEANSENETPVSLAPTLAGMDGRLDIRL